MSHLIISKKNEVYLLIEADPHIYYELKDSFQFEVPNAKFSPSYNSILFSIKEISGFNIYHYFFFYSKFLI